MAYQQQGSFVVGGANYGQGSSREHAALGPRYLGVIAVIAKSFARINLQNLSNFGILPLIFTHPEDWKKISPGDQFSIPDVRNAILKSNRIQVTNLTKDETYETEHSMTPYQVEMVLAGSLINLVKQKGLGQAKNQS
jgi:aconitate hydratase